MNDKKRIGNLINAKYKIPFVIGVFLLAVFLIFTMLKQADRPGLEPYPISKSSGDRLCIENVWDEQTNIVFTLRNCGKIDMTVDNFAGTGYYVNDIWTKCASDVTKPLNIGDSRTVTCPFSPPEGCLSGEGCDIIVKVRTVFDETNETVYRYVPN